MLSTRRWAQFALFLNLVGTVTLFYSFQATSSNIKIIRSTNIIMPPGKHEGTSLCAYGRSLMTQFDDGSGSILGPCPDWENARAAAVVNFEHPWLVTTGFICTFLGFAIQFFSIPTPPTFHELRQQSKIARRKEQKSKTSSPE